MSENVCGGSQFHQKSQNFEPVQKCVQQTFKTELLCLKPTSVHHGHHQPVLNSSHFSFCEF